MYSFDISVDDKILEKDIRFDELYQYGNLQLLKEQLNKTKNLLDKYKDERANYEKFMVKIYPYRLVKTELMKKISDELINKMITKAFIKCKELMNFISPMLEKKPKFYEYLSFHIAEAPGAFVPSIELFLQKFTFNWTWYAESYIDIYSHVDKHKKKTDRSGGDEENTKYLGDTYGFIKRHKDNWIFGTDGDGDITSSGNIMSFRHFFINPNVSSRLPDLLTGDVKYVPIDNVYAEEENQNYAVQLGQILAAILCVAEEGISILKMFTCFDSATVSMLYILSCCYEKCIITKPETSTITNSEIYVVSIGRKKLSSFPTRKLLDLLEHIRFNKTYIPILAMDRIPEEFASKIESCMKDLNTQQINALNDIIEMYEKSKIGSLDWKQVEEDQQIMANRWLDTNWK